MNEHVQGVKLRFELPFKLPAPVSFPFESIGDFRPISRIPKYDFSLEKKIMKEIAKQKQDDQFNMLRQAQQQLSMVDLIASRKNRHKGKEPERTAQGPANSSSNTASPLTKPRSDSGVTRPQSAAAAGVYSGTEASKRKQDEPSTPVQPQLKPQKLAQESSGPPAQFSSSASPAGVVAAMQGAQVERPHSAEPAITITQPATTARPVQPANSQPFAASTAAATYQPAYQHSSNTLSTPATSMSPNFYQAVAPRPQASMQQQPSQFGVYRPVVSAGHSMYPSPNFSTGYPIQSSTGQHPSLSATSPSGSLGPMLNSGTSNMTPCPIQQPQLRPQVQMQPASQPRPQLQTHLQIPPPQQQQPQPLHSQAGLSMATPQHINAPRIEPKPNRLSSSFGPHTTWIQGAPPSQSNAASRPALPPKPDEWKSGTSAATGAPPPSVVEPLSTSSSGPLPLPPRRPVNQSDPAAPAIPPKPFTSFSEFDYARDEPSGLNSSEQGSGHVEQVNTLVSMGFSRPQALQALEMYDYDVNKASNYLIDKAF
ncbi:hypothetical protein GGI00_000039 [Coemansia sp. RSA 2681]|nr:hypothetical protein GGI00_000039 [Coemansia sp. RSA 2681]